METLKTTADQLHDLLTAYGKVQRTSTTVKVDKDALINLLMDHHKMFGLCKDRVKEPRPVYANAQEATAHAV